MAAVTWTTEQQKVINLRKRNILVSAAAGSGKTAVLVERIITMITIDSNPIDIDRLLIVTFTKAAAAEMRERISAAIEQRLEENPDNVHLQRQQTLLHNAQIMTIDSFCLTVVRNHFHLIDLDPAFRIAEEAELTLMRSDCIAELLEEWYETGTEDFLEFIECYAGSKSDKPIEELILKLHRFSMSYPWPEDWLAEKKKAFAINDREQMENSEWMRGLLEYIDKLLKDALQMIKEAIAVCGHPDGPWPYEDALLSDREMLIKIIDAGKKGFKGYEEAFSQIEFKRLSSKRSEGILLEKKELVKALRAEIKDLLGGLKKEFFFQPENEMFLDLQAVKVPVEVLIDLTIEFLKRFGKKKESKNILDFNDLEHFALRILVEKKDGEVFQTAAAIDLSSQYAEILTDEYQDSNLVQETILTSISTERDGHPNMFMVGDVKQSIYKFRLARPEIFMDKYNRYSQEDSLYQRIDLHKNFRSREIVLNSINLIFEKIMSKGLGGIDYNEEAALYAGASYPEYTDDNRIQPETELILVESEFDSNSEEEELEVDTDDIPVSAREIEARAIAKKIKDLIEPEHGFCVKNGAELRPVGYGDIVVLLRTMTGWSEQFHEVLTAEGIPAYSDTQTGYFSSLEIRVMLNLLRILDNPRQDLPFTSVMLSPIVGLKGEELAKIRTGIYPSDLEQEDTILSFNEKQEGEETEKQSAREQKVRPVSYKEGKKMPICEAARQYSISGQELELKERLSYFFNLFDELRVLVPHLKVHELILEIFSKTGFDSYATAMPAGRKRRNNLDMLVQRAMIFEATSYHGLFHFIRYIERLIKFDVDYGESIGGGESENTVRIMSIHKSKGLEFPVVILAGMGKPFNNSDMREKLVLHPDYGVGPEYIDYRKRTKSPTLLKKFIQRNGILENLGEELRILYVAMTRAKEKLIMIGTTKDAQKAITKWTGDSFGGSKLKFCILAAANSYFDFVGPVSCTEPSIQRRIITASELMQKEVKEMESVIQLKEELLNPDFSAVYAKEVREELKKGLSFQYPYQKEAMFPIKTTVSELKRAEQAEEESAYLFASEKLGILFTKYQEAEDNTFKTLQDNAELIPKFLRKEEPARATDRGTLYHKVLESLPLDPVYTEPEIIKELDKLIAEGIIPSDSKKLLNINKLFRFYQSGSAERMRTAKKRGKLYLEQQFVIGIPAKELLIDTESEELVLIQGIIDVYFEEPDGLVLLDYKTDSVSYDGEELLKKRYQIQLSYYARALEQLTGKKVKNQIIYSFSLSKAIELL